MNKHASRAATAAVSFAALLLAACGGSSHNDNSNAPLAGTTLSVLSTRADLVSGDSALMEVKLPAGAAASKLKVMLGSTDVTSAFATRADGRIVGLVSGLVVGSNTVTVTATDSSFAGASLAVTDHPIGGPVLMGPQPLPWVCATPVPTAATTTTPGTNASGLSTNATDVQCNIAAEKHLYYRTLTPVTVTAGDGGCSFVLPDPSPTLANPNPTTPASSCLQPYVAGTTAASAVAPSLVSNGSGGFVPYIVQVERGTINRGIYDIAVLFDPTQPAWTANAAQPQWNRKVVYSYGASTGQPRQQFRSEQSWADDSALSRGFMVVDNSLTDSLYNSSRVLAAETTLMMKEHITNYYGEILYTMSNGCSGGSIGQNTDLSIYPGLLDGIQVQCDYPDSVTTAMEVTDCALLVNFYAGTAWQTLTATEGLTQAQIDAKKTAINGHIDQTSCHGWYNTFAFDNEPGNYNPVYVLDSAGDLYVSPTQTNNCKLPASMVYDPVTNPNGPRCGDPDIAASVWGTTAGIAPGSTRALQTLDNVGVQYGLGALLSGAINAEEFVTLNEGVGGEDADANAITTRMVADAAALPIAYKSGIVANGANLGKAAIIDLRGFDESTLSGGPYGIHYIWRSFSERDRLDQDAGGHGNQVMWRFGSGLTAPADMMLQSFLTMDTWLTSLMQSKPKAFVNDPHTQADVIAAKPATAFDYCYLSSDPNRTTQVTDQATCDADAKLAPHRSPRQVAGGPRTENILKCQLKPLSFADYGSVVFTTAQKQRLQAVFPSGVCDWTQPGVGQQAPTSPQSYMAGPGGVPLPPAPVSTPI